MLRRAHVFPPTKLGVFGILRRSASSCEVSDPSRGWVGSASGVLPLDLMSAHGGREAGSVHNPGERAVDDTRPTSKVTSCGYIVLDPQEFQGPWLMAIPYRGSQVIWQVDNLKANNGLGSPITRLRSASFWRKGGCACGSIAS